MSVDPYTQLLIFMYEYLNSKSDRAEFEYKQQLDYYYKLMFLSQPQKKISNYDLLSLIEKKVRYEYIIELQTELYDILNRFQKFR